MPSIILGQPLASGPQIIVSGNPWSGQQAQFPVGGIQFRWVSSGGNAYIGMSGGMTITSGGMMQSGGGLLDGMPMAPGDAYFIPRLGLKTSGAYTVYGMCDVAASGAGRLFFEIF